MDSLLLPLLLSANVQHNATFISSYTWVQYKTDGRATPASSTTKTKSNTIANKIIIEILCVASGSALG